MRTGVYGLASVVRLCNKSKGNLGMGGGAHTVRIGSGGSGN